MNETMKTILTRRSTRKFKVQELPEAELEQILQAALYAPSGMSKQTWQFTVVKNREKIQLLAKAVEKALGRERYDMYQPQVLIIPSNQRESSWKRGQCLRHGKYLPGRSFLWNRLGLDQPASGHLR